MATDPRDAEIARLTAANNALKGSLTVLDEGYKRVEAERDAALAQVAWLQDKVRFFEEFTREPDAALSRRDAQMRAEGRKEGLREAAEMAYGRPVHEHYVEWPWRGTGNRGRESELVLFARDLSATILAAAEKEET